MPEGCSSTGYHPFVLWPAAALFHALCPPSMHATRTHLDLSSTMLESWHLDAVSAGWERPAERLSRIDSAVSYIVCTVVSVLSVLRARQRPLPPPPSSLSAFFILHRHEAQHARISRSRGVAYRSKGAPLRSARAPCCPVEGWRQSPGLGPASHPGVLAAKVSDFGSNLLKCPRVQMGTKPAKVGHLAPGAI